MLRDSEVLALVDEATVGEQAVFRRLRVAARWNAEAHWASESHDAALALGVALDAIVGSRNALPGRLMAQRFAHLEADRGKRRERLRRYAEIFAVRSAVAHGGDPSRAADGTFMRGVAADVRWAAKRLYSLHVMFSGATEADIDDAFDRLALGELTW
jgi:hypothetical protein